MKPCSGARRNRKNRSRTAMRRCASSAPVLFQKFLDLDSGHTTTSSGGNSLTITAVLHITAGEDSVDGSHHVVVRFEIAVRVGLELASEHLRVGFMANAEEHRARWEVRNYAGFQIFQLKGGDFVFAGIRNIFDHRVGEELNLGVVLGSLQHDFGGKTGEEQSLLHCGIAPADHRDFFSREKEAIAGGAGGYAVADQLLFVGQSQPPRRGAAGDDQGLGVDLMFAEMKQEWSLAEVGAGEMGHAVFGAEALRLLAHILDQLWSHDSFRKTWEVLDKRGHRELPAGFMALHDKRFQIGARSVESRSVSGAAGADNYDVASFTHDFPNVVVRLRISDFDALCTFAPQE